MPLFRQSGQRAEEKSRARGPRSRKGTGKCWGARDEDSVPSLTRMCLLSLADNMKQVWVKDYAEKYLDQVFFRHIMGPFNLLPGDLVEELTLMLCSRKQLSRGALHLLLVPQLRGLSLESCPGLATPALCSHIAARCKGLFSLDLSEAQQLPSKVLCETLQSLPALRWLCLAGTPCDRSVIQTLVRCCRRLQHLDVSRCHLLPAAGLLVLGGLSSSSGVPLRSLLALDTGFEEQEGDAAVAAAYLLLSLPLLRRVALEGLGPGCRLIERREFSRAEEFAGREGVPTLEEVWSRRTPEQGSRESMKKSGESEEEESEEEQPSCSQILPQGPGPVLPLTDVRGVRCASLASLSRLCPSLNSLSVIIDTDEGSSGVGPSSQLSPALRTWAGRLWSLTFHYSGPLLDLVPSLQVAGSSLISLTLDGVRNSRNLPLLEVMGACPRLRELHISADAPRAVDRENWLPRQPLPQLPNLRSLQLSFAYEHSQRKPVMFWISLGGLIKSLLSGSPLLEKLLLVALPCHLDRLLSCSLRRPGDSAAKPLGRLQHADLRRTDVKAETLKCLMQQCRQLKHVDVSYCWQISQLEWLESKRYKDIQVVWV